MLSTMLWVRRFRVKVEGIRKVERVTMGLFGSVSWVRRLVFLRRCKDAVG